jgi:hypothetical protein
MASPAARNASADVAARQSIKPAMPHMVTLQTEAFAAPDEKPSNNGAPRNSYFLVKSRALYAWAPGGSADGLTSSDARLTVRVRANGAGRSRRQGGGLHERSRVHSSVAHRFDRQRVHRQFSPSGAPIRAPGVYSPTAANREATAAKANALELGPCRPFPSLEAMLISGEVDAVWIGVPNFVRLDIMREIHRLVKAGWAKLVGVACEKPLGRTLAEAREMLRLAEDAKLMHRYLENQMFLERRPARQGHRVAPRRSGLWPSLSGARRRGA